MLPEQSYIRPAPVDPSMTHPAHFQQPPPCSKINVEMQGLERKNNRPEDASSMACQKRYDTERAPSISRKAAFRIPLWRTCELLKRSYRRYRTAEYCLRGHGQSLMNSLLLRNQERVETVPASWWLHLLLRPCASCSIES